MIPTADYSMQSEQRGFCIAVGKKKVVLILLKRFLRIAHLCFSTARHISCSKGVGRCAACELSIDVKRLELL